MSDPAEEQRYIEEGKRFARSMGMSPELIAGLYNAPPESLPAESPVPPYPQSADRHTGEPRHRTVCLVWSIAVALAIIGGVCSAMLTAGQTDSLFIMTILGLSALVPLTLRPARAAENSS